MHCQAYIIGLAFSQALFMLYSSASACGNDLHASAALQGARGTMFHINHESDAFENPVTQLMQGISLHCIAVTESPSYCVHHYSRSTSAGIFNA